MSNPAGERRETVVEQNVRLAKRVAALEEQNVWLLDRNNELVQQRRDAQAQLELARVSNNALGSVMLDMQRDCIKLQLQLNELLGQTKTGERHGN
jgi:hypothetical protein